MTSEVDRIGADAASNPQHFLAAPMLKVGESGDMRFHSIFTPFHFVKIFFGSDWLRRMADVTGAAVPVVLNSGERDALKK